MLLDELLKLSLRLLPVAAEAGQVDSRHAEFVRDGSRLTRQDDIDARALCYLCEHLAAVGESDQDVRGHYFPLGWVGGRGHFLLWADGNERAASRSRTVWYRRLR